MILRAGYRVVLIPFVCALVLAMPSSVAISGGNPKRTPPRFAPPSGGKPGYVDIEKYFRIGNPQEAGRLVLSEAALAQVDVDQMWPSDHKAQIELPSGPIRPDRKDKSLFQSAAALVKQARPNQEMICLVKFSRIPTIRELAGMMNSGVRFFRGVPYDAYIVRVSAETAVALEQMEPVEWVGEYLADEKYSPTKEFVDDLAIWVYTLPGDLPECRADLARLGGEVISIGDDGWYHHDYEFFVVRVEAKRVPSIAALWWVQKIEQGGHGEGNESTGIVDSTEAPTSTSTDFAPIDSRKLVSWQRNRRYHGDSQEVLLYETECYTAHGDFYMKVIPGSDASTSASDASRHGAEVAGIAVGMTNDNVTGGVSGVADGAAFFFRRHVRNQESDAGVAADNGFWIQNHSWGLFNPPYDDSLGVYTSEARLFDSYADGKNALIIKSAGNQGHQNGPQSPETITSPGTGKNVLAVGGVLYVPQESVGDTLGKIGSYSSLGPTRNDLLKPELVAPGGGPESSCLERGVVSCSPPNPGCLEWTPGYSRNVGCSFAAAHVTGAAAVVAEWYEDWYTTYHYADPDLALTSDLLRAMLVNAAIPLRWNGTWPNDFGNFGDSPEDTIATDDAKRGFANTTYGYGLVNCHSGVASREDEYRRILVWQESVEGVGATSEKEFVLRILDSFGSVMRPRYLIVTMAYSDLPAAGIADHLELSLQDPLGRIFTYMPPQGLDAGTVQKIIVPFPTIAQGGRWKARVKLASTAFTRPFPRQDFAVVADAMMETPRLQVSNSGIYLCRLGELRNVTITVTNTGGNVAAGVTLRIVDPSFKFGPSSDTNKTYFVGNLLDGGARASRTFKIYASSAAGHDYPVTVEVGTINKVMGDGPLAIS